MWGGGYGERVDTSVGPRLAWAAALTLVLPAQAVLAPIVSVGGAIPDFPLLALLLFSLYHGPALSAAAGAALGTGLDLFAAGGGPFHLVAYPALAVAFSSIGRITPTVRTVTVVALAALGSLVLGVGHMVWGAPVERADELLGWFTTKLVPQALYDSGSAWVLFIAWIWRYPPPHDGLGDRDDFFSARRLQGLIR
ncbi:MAG: hypothetical protein AB1451_04200 [Nitrospirota bacterium]